MRVLFVSNYYPPYEVGGYEQLCRDVAVRLAGRGHEVQVLTSDRGTGQGRPLNEPGVHRVLRLQLDYGAPLSPALQFYLTRRQARAHNVAQLRALARRFEPHVVFVWNLQGLCHSLAVEAESLPQVAVAYWLAGYSPAEPDGYWRYWQRTPEKRGWLGWLKPTLRQVALRAMEADGLPACPQMAHVAVVSEYMRRRGMVDGTIPPHAQVIYNGVEVEAFRRPPRGEVDGPLTLLVAGRVSPDKGVHSAVEALGHLARGDSRRGLRLLIAGSGPEEYVASLRQIARRQGVGELISFLGRLPREQMPELMSRCHVLLLTAIHPEALPRIVLEAMASGLAVVGTLVGGTGELLEHGRTGLAYRAGDSQDLAQQVRRLAADPALRYRLAAQGQRKVSDSFSMEHMMDRIEDFLDDARVRGRSSG